MQHKHIFHRTEVFSNIKIEFIKYFDNHIVFSCSAIKIMLQICGISPMKLLMKKELFLIENKLFCNLEKMKVAKF